MKARQSLSGKSFSQSALGSFQIVSNESAYAVKNFQNDFGRPSNYDNNQFAWNANGVDSLKQELYEYAKSVIYSISGDLISLKNNVQNNGLSIETLFKQIEGLNTTLNHIKNTNHSDLCIFKDTIQQVKDQDRKLIDEIVQVNLIRVDRKVQELELAINNSLNSTKLNSNTNINNNNNNSNNNAFLDTQNDFLRKSNGFKSSTIGINDTNNVNMHGLPWMTEQINMKYMTIDQANKLFLDIINEVEKKLAYLNDKIRADMKIMDINFVEIIKKKDQEINKLTQAMKSLENSFLSETKLRSSPPGKEFAHSSTDFHPSNKHNHPLDDPGLFSPIAYNNNNAIVASDNKRKDLEASLKNMILIEKDLRSKCEFLELNMNSVKRNIELELSIAMKQLVVPIQINIEEYMKSAESRISKLEDVVLHQLNKESMILSGRKANKLRISALEETAKNLLKNTNIQMKEINEQAKRLNIQNDSIGQYDEMREEDDDDNEHHDQLDVNTNMSMSIADDDIANPDPATDPEIVIDPEIAIDSEIAIDPRVTMESKVTVNHDKANENVPDDNICLIMYPDKDGIRPSPYYKLSNEPKPKFEMQKEDEISSKININTIKQQKKIRNMQNQEQPDVTTTTTIKSKPIEKAPDGDSNNNSKQNSSRNSQIAEQQSIKSNSGKHTHQKNQVNSGSEIKVIDTAAIEEKSQVNVNNNLSEKKNDPLVESIEEPEEYQGNLKGLLKKSRNKKDALKSPSNPKHNQSMHQNTTASTMSKNNDQDFIKPNYHNKSLTNQLTKNLGPEILPKPLDLGLSKSKKVEKNELPPLNSKDPRDMNSLNPLKGNYHHHNQQQQHPQGPMNKNMQKQPYFANNKSNNYNRPSAHWEEYEADESPLNNSQEIEEIVYNVNEEGFLVDEEGNFIVDEQGNFLKLSPEHMKEIENNDIIFDEGIEYRY